MLSVGTLAFSGKACLMLAGDTATGAEAERVLFVPVSISFFSSITFFAQLPRTGMLIRLSSVADSSKRALQSAFAAPTIELATVVE